MDLRPSLHPGPKCLCESCTRLRLDRYFRERRRILADFLSDRGYPEERVARVRAGAASTPVDDSSVS